MTDRRVKSRLGATLDELDANLRESIAMLLEDGEPTLLAKFVGTQAVIVD